jgi:hypothetical protein
MKVPRSLARLIVRAVGGVAGLVRDELDALSKDADGWAEGTMGKIASRAAGDVAKRARSVERRVTPCRRK